MLPSRGRGKQYRENRDRRADQSKHEHPNSQQLASKETRPSASGTSTRVLRSNEFAINPEELGIQFKRKLACTSDLPTTPGDGRLGKRIKLISNCYPVKIPSGYVYHYDVTITKKNTNIEQSNTALVLRGDKYRCLNTRKNREIITLMLDRNPLFNDTLAAYDGRKNIFTRIPLHAPFPIKSEVVLPNENYNPENPDGQQETFVVEIKPVTKKESSSYAINLDLLHAFLEKRISIVPQEVLMALETILRHGPCLRFVPIGHSFFSPPHLDNLHPLGGGIEVWFGHHQSIRLGQWGPMVNLDVTATTFHQKGPVLNYIAEYMNVSVRELRRRPFLQNTDVKRMSNKLKNLKIEVTHLRNYRRKYRIVKMVKENAHRLEFDMTENGRTVKKTVAAYFRERYGRILEFPNLPCLQVSPENKKIYLPVEVCEIIDGQHFKKKLEPKQIAEMIKFTANSPAERFSKIRQIANDADFNNDRHVQEFNMTVSNEPIHLEGRILDSPSIRYMNGEIVKPKDGSWNMKQSKFLLGANIDSWVLLSFANLDIPALKKFSNFLVKMGQEAGISIKCPVFIDVIDILRCDLKNLLTTMKAKYNASLAVIVLPTNDKVAYGKIKQAAETVIGLVTQCIRESSISNPRKCSSQLMNNLCQKINAKMGGENNTLLYQEIPRIMHKPIIIIGADVNHPGASRGVKPSLAACIGSLNMNLSRYAVSIRAQVNMDERKQSVEVICDLKNMILELLKAFYRHTNRKKPEKIIFYRDGVSEGQFLKVRDHEVKGIREACRTLGEDYQPGITFIVVQKRHHIRFMPENPRDGIGNMRNIPPGTTVDTDVTHPSNFDFFLCSHFGIKGTSRPSHYTVLEDDNNFTADDLQKLTYQLCHTYARCTRSISIPVPVAYAHLAAYRARTHLEAVLEDSTSTSDSSDGLDGQPLPQSVIDAIKVIDGLKSAMYYV